MTVYCKNCRHYVHYIGKLSEKDMATAQHDVCMVHVKVIRDAMGNRVPAMDSKVLDCSRRNEYHDCATFAPTLIGRIRQAFVWIKQKVGVADE